MRRVEGFHDYGHRQRVRRPEEVEYVCAHGPSDVDIDRVETDMIKQVFGKRAYRIPVSSIKGVTGNPLAAAGPFELIATALAMKTGLVPPLRTTRPLIRRVTWTTYQHGRAADISCAIVNVHGLGRSNGSLLLERVSLQ